MPIPFPSALIRYERLKRNWSQEGLCEGVCAVSYLSKIEQGKAEPNPAILQALMGRLSIVWHAEAASEAKALTEKLWEAIQSMDWEAESGLRKMLLEKRALYLNGPHMLDVLLLERLRWEWKEPPEVPLQEMEEGFDAQQRAWYLMVQNRYEDALLLMPNAMVYLGCGRKAYSQGDHTLAMERLMQCCTKAAEEGRARVLMHARMLLGNCYSDQGNVDAMLRHYQAAKRLALDLQDADVLAGIDYNTAATAMQTGHYEEALRYLTSLASPGVMALHKTAICQEKLEMREAALQTLCRAGLLIDDPACRDDYPPQKWMERMCALVRYRLEHPEYLHDETYGSMLVSAYTEMKKELPNGYALFHQPWVEEWYVANRQYKQAYEMKKMFS